MSFFENLIQNSTNDGLSINSVGVVVFTELGQILLGNNSGFPLVYDLPHGIIKKGQDIGDVIGSVLNISSDLARDSISMYINHNDYKTDSGICRQFNFALSMNGDSISLQNMNAAKFKWFSLADIFLSKPVVKENVNYALKIFDFNKKLKIMGTQRSILAYCYDEEI